MQHFNKAAVLLLSLTYTSEALTKIHKVYWNTTNPIFRIDNTDHIVDVNNGNLPWEYDQLNLICPHNSLEKHIVYSVTKEEFEGCRVTNPKPKIVAICNKPESFMYFTITFRTFSPTPGGLEFKPGQTYYLISTSTQRDIHRRAGGFCSSHNMKMVFNVADREPQPSVNSPLLSAVTSTTTRRPRAPASPSSAPVYYYKSRAPSVHTSDYIYYYSPRDLVQLKLAARKHDRGQINTEKEQDAADRRAAPLTSSSSSRSSASVTSLMSVSLGLIILLCLL